MLAAIIGAWFVGGWMGFALAALLHATDYDPPAYEPVQFQEWDELAVKRLTKAVLIEPPEPNPHVERVLREGRKARLEYEAGRNGERDERCACGEEIPEGRRRAGARSCFECSPYKEVIRP